MKKSKKNNLHSNFFCKPAPDTLSSESHFLKISNHSLEEYTAHFMDISQFSQQTISCIAAVHPHSHLLDVLFTQTNTSDSGSTTPFLSENGSSSPDNLQLANAPQTESKSTSSEKFHTSQKPSTSKESYHKRSRSSSPEMKSPKKPSSCSTYEKGKMSKNSGKKIAKKNN